MGGNVNRRTLRVERLARELPSLDAHAAAIRPAVRIRLPSDSRRDRNPRSYRSEQEGGRCATTPPLLPVFTNAASGSERDWMWSLYSVCRASKQFEINSCTRHVLPT